LTSIIRIALQSPEFDEVIEPQSDQTSFLLNPEDTVDGGIVDAKMDDGAIF
jgi:hypothetical protein